MRVTCTVCGKTYMAKVPKGGDGSVLFPRKHYRKLVIITGNRVHYKGDKEVCPGSYREVTA